MATTNIHHHKCTVGPDAVDRKRCGKPAVTCFVGSDGVTYYECADHAVGGAHVAEGTTVEVWRHGKAYVGRVVRVTPTKVFAKVTYDNGVTRVVEV